MKVFKINWDATASHPKHEHVLTQVEKEYGFFLCRGSKFITLDRQESDSFEDAVLFASRADAQSWGQGLVGQWRIDNTLPKRGRPTGFSPINGDGGAMTKKNKAWSMSDDDWEWLESQPNQSETIRSAIALLRSQPTNQRQ